MNERKCSVEGCGRDARARFLCLKHYQAQRKSGALAARPYVNSPSTGLCKVNGCVRRDGNLGYCNLHYERYYKHGDAGPPGLLKMRNRGCEVEGCSRPHSRFGYCQTHWRRLKNHGDAGSAERWTRASGVGEQWLRDHARFDGPKCLTWPFKLQKGYAGWVTTSHGRMLAYRYMCILVNGSPPFEGAYALHRCGRGALACCDGRCLYWGTQADNVADALAHGTMARGERLPQAKLKEDQVRLIRASDESPSDLARRFEVAPQTIRDVLDRKSWTHVD